MPSALLLHGMFGSPELMEPLGREFRNLGWSVRVPDLYEGRTAESGFQDYVRRAREARSALEGEGEPVIIVGHSMGGLIGQKLSAERSASALALVCSAPPMPIPTVNWSLAWAILGNWGNLSSIAMGTELVVNRQDADQFLFNAVSGVRNKDRLFRMLRPELGSVAWELLSGILVGEVGCDVLCLTARHDRIVPRHIGSQLASLYRAPNREFDSAGHMLVVEEPQRVAEEVAGWWESKNV